MYQKNVRITERFFGNRYIRRLNGTTDFEKIIFKRGHGGGGRCGGLQHSGNRGLGGTNTIYVSPVPFEELNKAVEKGKGKPHLKPVEDTMAQANNLAAAMLIAPVAGIAAAVGKYIKRSKTVSKGA